MLSHPVGFRYRLGGKMKKQIIRGLVTSVTRVSSTLSKVQVRLSHGLKYHPGQSIWISPMTSRFMGSGVTGFYQLCGCPEAALRSNNYEFLVETNPVLGLLRGLGKVRPGDFLEVEGPFGTFWPLRARPEENVVWIATPEKLGPFLACVQSSNFERIRPRKILLLVQVANEEALPYRELFESKGVAVIPCFQHPSQWVNGFLGGLSTLMRHEKFRLDFKTARYFISAASPLVQEVWNLLVHEKGVPSNQVVHEANGVGSQSIEQRFREHSSERLKAA